MKLKPILLAIIALHTLTTTAKQYVKTAYFTHVYVREHKTDMPRGFYLLIDANGEILPLGFERYSSKNVGDLSPWQFDPRTLLGKTLDIDFTGNTIENNNEYPVLNDGNLLLIPKVRIDIINSIKASATSIKVDDKYLYTHTDTLFIPHDVTIKEESYPQKAPTHTVQLKNFVNGNGTNSSPYTSSDGSAGLDKAFKALPQGGTVEVEQGVYNITAKGIRIPRFINLKGIGDIKPEFTFSTDKVWILEGSNTLENIVINIGSKAAYSQHMIEVADNARDVHVKNVKIVGAYHVDPSTYKQTNKAVCFRLSSHISNLTFEQDTFQNVYRGIVCKGQRNQHQIIVRKCLFTGPSYTPISLDQSSNISEVVIEDNTFQDFNHFGIAFARINGVTLRNNTFFSRNRAAEGTYNQGIHLEEHCQNFLIEGNQVDVLMRHKESANPTTVLRNSGLSVSDSRYIKVLNNTFVNSNIIFAAGESLKSGYSVVQNNTVENGRIQVQDANNNVIIRKNNIIAPPESAIMLYCSKPMLFPFKGHRVDSNLVTKMNGKEALNIRGEVQNCVIENNTFQGCSQKPMHLDFRFNSKNVEISKNTFYGLNKNTAFEIIDGLPTGNSKAQYEASNSFSTRCDQVLKNKAAKLETKLSVFPNPTYGTLKVQGLPHNNHRAELIIYSLCGHQVMAMPYQSEKSTIELKHLPQGAYFITINGYSNTYKAPFIKM